MTKIAFKMKLKPGNQEEYIRRHQFVWPEVKQLLKKAGVSDYSIFLDAETDTLFAVQVLAGDEGSQDLGTREVIRKWWDYMKDIMVTNPDHSPVSIPLVQVFHME